MYNIGSNPISLDTGYAKRHDWRKLLLIITTILIFIVTVVFNGLQTRSTSLFPRSAGNISDTYFTDITPAGWVFIIWGFIYAWQAIWLLYSLICVFRRTESGDYVYLKGPFLHYGIFIAFIVNLCFNIGWLFLWSYEHLGWSLLFLCIITFSLYVALFISYRKLNQYEDTMRNERLVADIWLVRLFIQNGISFYATWVSIASNLNFAIYITWRLHANNQNAGTGALILILSAVIAYSIIENFVWPHYLIYTFSPWIVLIVALSGVVSKNWIKSNPSRNNIIALVMLIIVVILAIFKIIMFILYQTVLKQRFLNRKRGNK